MEKSQQFMPFKPWDGCVASFGLCEVPAPDWLGASRLKPSNILVIPTDGGKYRFDLQTSASGRP